MQSIEDFIALAAVAGHNQNFLAHNRIQLIGVWLNGLIDTRFLQLSRKLETLVFKANRRCSKKTFATKGLLFLHPRPIPVFPMLDRRKLLSEIFRFLLVSGISFTIDAGVYLGLTTQFDIDGSWAKRISFACISVWGYFAHKHFTFRHRTLNRAEPIRF
ncbi:MAG: GtrA family protein, partial [Verrucomicrobiia bacterium]